jgi:hypothetical protein
MAEEKVIPAAIQKTYDFFSHQSNYLIDQLFILLEKIKATTVPAQKEAHLIGFKLGLAVIGAVGKQLTDAYDQLTIALADVEKEG